MNSLLDPFLQPGLLMGLGQNIALVLALLMIDELLAARMARWSRLPLFLIHGLLFAAIAIIGMQFPIRIQEGVHIDGRVVLVALATAFYGPKAGLIATAIVTGYRLYLGGVGAPAGALSIILAYGCGLLTWWLHGGNSRIGPRPLALLVLGLGIAIAGLAAVALLPADIRGEALMRFLMPVIILYPLATVVLGWMIGLHQGLRADREELRLGRDRLHLATEATKLGIWEWHLADNSLIWDQRMFAIYGLARERFRGTFTDWAEHLIPEERAAVEAELAQFLRKGTELHSNFRIVRGDGAIRSIRVAAQVLRDEQGQALRVLGADEDITEAVAVRQELEAHRSQLSQLVTERTAELAAATAAAEAASAAKSQFLATMSHELRTPLNAVLGYAQVLLRDTNLRPDQHQALAEIQRSGEALLHLISDILAMARLEAGRESSHQETVNLRSVCRSVISESTSIANEKELHMLLEITPEFPTALHCDERKVRGILRHLLGNALKFSKQGTVRVHLDWHQGWLEVTVEDQGPGIDDEVRARLFTPFAVSPVSLRHGGTGLGLAISHAYAELMGGSLELLSPPGRGCRLRLRLPAPLAAGETARPPSRELPKPQTNPSFDLLLSLRNCPDSWRRAFRAQVEAGDVEAARLLLSDLADPECAHQLRRQVDAFAFAPLLDLLDAATEKSAE